MTAISKVSELIDSQFYFRHCFFPSPSLSASEDKEQKILVNRETSAKQTGFFFLLWVTEKKRHNPDQTVKTCLNAERQAVRISFKMTQVFYVAQVLRRIACLTAPTTTHI